MPRALRAALAAGEYGARPADSRDARGADPDVQRDGPEVPGDPEQPLGDPESVARAICLRLLTQRARSRAELAGALERRGVPAESAARVLDRFTEVGLIDDLELAQTLAGAQHRERGLARRAVAAKLRQRGLDADAIDRGLAGIDAESERRRAEQLVDRKLVALAGLPTPVQQRRLVGLLARKGYPSSLAYEVVRQALSSRAEPAADPRDELELPADDL
ncbi:regulatory protein RecX [uncultured Jatrophihabitans sp.]|uniref:regulatory protein RecX n=1 Tax=uncultured Jatrophihabitans sp. TaxID=1610747 RepID=UPI0035CA5F83